MRLIFPAPYAALWLRVHCLTVRSWGEPYVFDQSRTTKGYSRDLWVALRLPASPRRLSGDDVTRHSHCSYEAEVGVYKFNGFDFQGVSPTP